MAVGAPDWEKVVTVRASMAVGAPDWERVVTGPGGTSIGGYASLTGPGQTATPGLLNQAGGFYAVDTQGNGFAFNDEDFGGIQVISNASITINGGQGATLESGQTTLVAGTDEVDVLSQSGPIHIEAGGGQVLITSDSHGLTLTLPNSSSQIDFYTGASVATLPTPNPNNVRAFGFTADGHIGTWPASGGPWATLI